MAPTDDASDPLVIQPWIQHIGRQLNTLQLNMWNPGRGRWTELRRQKPQLNSGAHPRGPEQNYGGREITGPCPSTEVPIGQECRSTTESPTDSQASAARRQLPRFGANVEQSSSSHQDWGVLGPPYESQELSSASWPARTRNTHERVRYATVWNNWAIANLQIAGTIFRSKMDKYRCTEWAHNALNIGIYLTIN